MVEKSLPLSLDIGTTDVGDKGYIIEKTQAKGLYPYLPDARFYFQNNSRMIGRGRV